MKKLKKNLAESNTSVETANCQTYTKKLARTSHESRLTPLTGRKLNKTSNAR